MIIMLKIARYENNMNLSKKNITGNVYINAGINKKLLSNGKNGSILILTVAGLMFFLLLMGLVVDVTYCFIVRNQLRNLADNAALSAIGEYIDRTNKGELRTDALDAAIKAAQEVGSMTRTLDQPSLSITIADSDVVFGSYDQNTQTFTQEQNPDDPNTNINAIRVTVRKDGLNPRYKFYLKTLTGFRDASLNAHAVSSLVRKNIMFILDISASMDNNTYPNNNRNIRPNNDVDPAGIDYYDFKTYPVSEYAFGTETLGGVPEPINNLVEIIRDFFGTTLPGILEQNDNIGFLTFNLNVQDRVKQVTSGDLFVKPADLYRLENLCQHTLNFYLNYISDAMFLSRSDYNPVIHRSWIDNFYPYDTSYQKSSIVDYKYAKGGYPSGTAMYELEYDDTIIFPGGRYPSGEKVDHFLRIPGGTDIEQEGFTNMGFVLETARNSFNYIGSTSEVPAFNLLILLTDGLPNVYRNFTHLRSSYYGQRYAREEATLLKDNGVRICTIFYKTRGADGEDFLRDYIASSTDYAFTADDPNVVDTILDEIMKTFPYVLVE